MSRFRFHLVRLVGVGLILLIGIGIPELIKAATR